MYYTLYAEQKTSILAEYFTVSSHFLEGIM
jgi:hypothetical protein